MQLRGMVRVQGSKGPNDHRFVKMTPLEETFGERHGPKQVSMERALPGTGTKPNSPSRNLRQNLR